MRSIVLSQIHIRQVEDCLHDTGYNYEDSENKIA